MTFSKSLPTFNRGVISGAQIVVAGVLLVGVVILGYGFFEQNTIGLYVGLVVILAGVLNGLVRILARGKS